MSKFNVKKDYIESCCPAPRPPKYVLIIKEIFPKKIFSILVLHVFIYRACLSHHDCGGQKTACAR